MSTQDKPFGYWLRYLDHLIEDCFVTALRAHGLSGAHWQVLNLLRAHPAHPAEIIESMWPFWDDLDVSPDEVLRAVVRRGWVERDRGGRFILTLEGDAALEQLSGKACRIREVLTEGITPDEYDMVVALLQRMADNLTKAGVSR
ncbi:MarR family winged helix-turn-helix transcriptional regulator [Planosporangium sp. 12N6]|uniref:MarR family winged helix-turn-helix transcriptional regulator n=1 Tax=Planosporangium spinosum TaxID=3402278 RepID=UPI003CF0742E